MEMIRVRSSAIRAIGYDGNTLIIKFNSGRVYAYHQVPYEVYADLITAYSIGAYYNRHIRGRYR